MGNLLLSSTLNTANIQLNSVWLAESGSSGQRRRLLAQNISEVVVGVQVSLRECMKRLRSFHGADQQSAASWAV
jgi:hypothetical protein